MELKKVLAILSEKDIEKQRAMIDALPEKEKQAYLKEAEKIRNEAVHKNNN